MPLAPITLRCGGLELIVDVEDGGRASSLRVDGSQILGARSQDPHEHGMYPMGPWAGRIRDNRLSFDGRTWPMPASYGPWALHGTVLARPWVLIGLVQERDHAWLAITSELGEAWPWRGSMDLTWSLNRSVLRTSMRVRAHDAQFPAVIGMHPWFRKQTSFGVAQWQMAGGELAVRDQQYRLSGELVTVQVDRGTFDDAFRAVGRRAHVKWGDGLSLEIHQSHPWFVVYDLLDDLLCVEPQTGPPDGVNANPFGPVTIVSPGKPLSQQVAWAFTRG